MFNLDTVTTKNYNKTWPYRMLIIDPSISGKTNILKDLEEPKYQLLVKKRENAGLKNVNDPNAFTEYSNTMDDVYDIIDDYSQKRKSKVLIVFDDMIADIMPDKKFQIIIKELFIRCRKLNISLVFITKSCFSVPKDVRLNSTHYLIFKVNNRRELQNIAINHSADIDYRDFLKIYRNCAKEPYSFFTINTRLTADNPIRFGKNFHDSPL